MLDYKMGQEVGRGWRSTRCRQMVCHHQPLTEACRFRQRCLQTLGRVQREDLTSPVHPWLMHGQPSFHDQCPYLSSRGVKSNYLILRAIAPDQVLILQQTHVDELPVAKVLIVTARCRTTQKICPRTCQYLYHCRRFHCPHISNLSFPRRDLHHFISTGLRLPTFRTNLHVSNSSVF